MKFNKEVRLKRSELIEKLKVFAPKYANRMNDPDDIALIPFVIEFLDNENRLEDLLDEVVDALLVIDRCLGQKFQQLTHVNLGFQHGEDLQAGRTDGDGHSDCQKLFGGGAVAQGGIVRDGQVPIGRPLLAVQIDGRYQTAHRNAHNGGAGGIGHTAGLPHNCQCQHQTHHQLEAGLQNLGIGGGAHIALPLEKAPIG